MSYVGNLNPVCANAMIISHLVPKQLKELYSLGFKCYFLDSSFSLFKIFLPKGWKVTPLQDGWSAIFDDQNRKRGVLDTELQMLDLIKRFDCSIDPIMPNDWSSPLKVTVKDVSGKVIFTAGKCDGLFTKEYRGLIASALNHLNSNYPEWNDPTKYWDMAI